MAAAGPIEKKIKKAIKAKKMAKVKGPRAIEVAENEGVITAQEAKTMREAEELRWDAIQVDHFSQEEYLSRDL